MIKYYTRACNFYYGSTSKDKLVEKPEKNDDESSALGAMGLKPKIVH